MITNKKNYEPSKFMVKNSLSYCNNIDHMIGIFITVS